MTTDWAVSTGADRVDLQGGQGSITFTVANPGPVQDRAVLDIVPSEGAEPDWFTVELPQRMIGPQTAASYAVVVKPPAEAKPGDYWFQGRVYSADIPPEESSKLSGRIPFTVGAAGQGFPWWIPVAAVLLVAVVGVVGWLVLSGDQAKPDAAPTRSPSAAKPVKVAVPTLRGLSEQDALAVLADKGLKAGRVKHRQQPAEAGKVLQQSPDQNTEVAPGTPIELEVAVSLGAAALSAPSSGATFPRGSAFPTLSWQPVPDAAGYRVRVQTEACVYLVFGIACTYDNNAHFGSTYSDYHATSTLTATGNTITPTIQLKVQPDVPRAGHSGNVRWMVQAVDDFGNAGPDSGYFTFHMVLRDPDVWGPTS